MLKLGENIVPNQKQNENKGHHNSKNFCHIIQAVNTLPLPIESNGTILALVSNPQTLFFSSSHSTNISLSFYHISLFYIQEKQ